MRSWNSPKTRAKKTIADKREETKRKAPALKNIDELAGLAKDILTVEDFEAPAFINQLRERVRASNSGSYTRGTATQSGTQYF